MLFRMAAGCNKPVGNLPDDSSVLCQEDSLVHIGVQLSLTARSCVTAHTCMQTGIC